MHKDMLYCSLSILQKTVRICSNLCERTGKITYCDMMQAENLNMTSDTRFSMPDDFPKRIHEALKNWHSQRAENVLADLLLFRHHQGSQNTATTRLISNKILLEGIESLKQ